MNKQNQPDEKIAVLIMLGGKSTRMGGGIKSLIEFNNKNIFERILNKVQPQISKIIVNCNEQEEKIKKYNLPIIKDIKKGYLGPLAGIHAGMHWLSNNHPQMEWLITLPGDSHFIPSDLILRFKNMITTKSNILLARSNKKIHPIIGAWKINLLQDLEINLDKGTRKILEWAEIHNINFVDFSHNNYDPFFNINTKEDIIEATQIEKKFL